jgi:hypothetical protein
LYLCAVEQFKKQGTMKTENTAAQAAQSGNGGKNALNAKPLFGLAKRRKQPERCAQFGLKFIQNID